MQIASSLPMNTMPKFTGVRPQSKLDQPVVQFSGNNPAQPKFGGWKGALAGLAMLGAAVGATAYSGFYVVDPGDAAVITRLGTVVKDTKLNGPHVKIPYLDEAIIYDISEINTKATVEPVAKGGIALPKFDVYLRYDIDENKLPELTEKVIGSSDFVSVDSNSEDSSAYNDIGNNATFKLHQKVINRAVRAKAQEVIGQLYPEQAAEKRNLIEKAFKEGLVAGELGAGSPAITSLASELKDYGVTIKFVQPGTMKPAPEIVGSLQNKADARIQLDAAKDRAEAKKQEAMGEASAITEIAKAQTSSPEAAKQRLQLKCLETVAESSKAGGSFIVNGGNLCGLGSENPFSAGQATQGLNLMLDVTPGARVPAALPAPANIQTGPLLELTPDSVKIGPKG